MNVEILQRLKYHFKFSVCPILFCVLVIILLGGCETPASLKKSSIAQPPVQKSQGINTTSLPANNNRQTVKSKNVDGIIFGKADFRGILKVEYVKLNIVDEDNPQKHYELLFGERDENNEPRWDARPLEPHYFFLELPAGHYRITTISIPVGTTLATENADIAFTVQKETVIYLGTLRVVGTDQKIRFGGVPFLRPGFEYRVEIINEKEEALITFKNKYPNLDREIQVNLMKAIRFQSF